MGFEFEFRPQAPPPGDSLFRDVARWWTERPSRVDEWDLPAREEGYFEKIVKACGLLARVEASAFRLSGFGAADWGLDVGYDMSAFVEGLPELLGGLSARVYTELELYPQGVESVLGFEPAGEDVQVRCRSMNAAWTPEDPVEIIPRAELVRMIERLQHDFARGLEMIDPQLVTIDPFNLWRHIPA
jgi:hypothetical protein